MEIAGRPALDRLDDLVRPPKPTNDRSLASGLQIGIAIDEHRATFERGDFLIRSVVGADPSSRRHRRGRSRSRWARPSSSRCATPTAADEDLRAMLAGHGRRRPGLHLQRPGQHLFGEPDHDAGVVHELLGRRLAGMFCAGEIGPVGGRNFVHGFTASVLLFSAPVTRAK